MATTGRVYGGLTPEQRHERRRESFLQAGLEVFAAKGWTAATVLDVCRAARLSQRYFYEHFTGREALFLAVMGHVADDVEARVRAAATVPGASPAERAAGVLRAIAGAVGEDPRIVRVVLVESLATADFRAQRAALLGSFSALAAQLMRALHPDPPGADGRALELSATVLSGGVAELLMASVAPGEHGELIDHLVRLYTAAATLA